MTEFQKYIFQELKKMCNDYVVELGDYLYETAYEMVYELYTTKRYGLSQDDKILFAQKYSNELHDFVEANNINPVVTDDGYVYTMITMQLCYIIDNFMPLEPFENFMCINKMNMLLEEYPHMVKFHDFTNMKERDYIKKEIFNNYE